jgi:hypothetical protein
MTRRKLRLTYVVTFVVVAVAGAVAAATRFHVFVTPTRSERVYVRLPGHHAFKKTGKLSEAECRAIKKGTSIDDLILTYGKPQGQSMEDVYLWGPWYPVTDQPDGSLCELNSYDGKKVTSKDLDIQL